MYLKLVDCSRNVDDGGNPDGLSVVDGLELGELEPR